LLPISEETEEAEAPVYIYVSRRGHTRRPFLNEPEIEDIARNLGFTIVQPELLPFLDQVRLFRRAAGVAGPEGAAFANIIFCKPGARILTLLNENDLFPTYNDIAAVTGLKHRKLAGVSERDFYGVNFLWSPYRIDSKQATRDLRWALEG
jgi:capsular polysaccharide biosynthesis protein